MVRIVRQAVEPQRVAHRAHDVAPAAPPQRVVGVGDAARIGHLAFRPQHESLGGVLRPADHPDRVPRLPRPAPAVHERAGPVVPRILQLHVYAVERAERPKALSLVGRVGNDRVHQVAIFVLHLRERNLDRSALERGVVGDDGVVADDPGPLRQDHRARARVRIGLVGVGRRGGLGRRRAEGVVGDLVARGVD